MGKDLLFEIGVEEIPASFVLPALEQLREALVSGLDALSLAHGEALTYGTPRRLALMVRDVAERQPDAQKEYKGPPVDKAYDAEGKPTQAAIGFARTRGVDVSELKIFETDKGAWVGVTVTEQGQDARAVLPELLERATLGLTFPKTMRWADLDLRFARPIRWLVALFGSEVIDVEIAGVRAGAVTRGHRVLGSSEITLKSPSEYVPALRANYVLADVQERQETIRAQAEAVAASLGGRARIDPDLLTEINFLVEWPTCFAGSFDARFLQLPDPVIVKVMQGHQRYFPVEDSEGRLMPYFIAVRNGTDEGIDIVRAGNEKVIVPRLADAEFYLMEDLKHSLDERVASLERVTFMEGLGTLADKTQRLRRLCAMIAQADPRISATDAALLDRAAQLCKTDLVTLMVGDSKLGELQGVVGGEYARRLGEPEAVAVAIAEHYRPRGVSDEMPSTALGTALSIADKVDNLAACFRLGAIPSGSADPFALRRQAQGIVDMLLASGLRLDLRSLLLAALEALPEPQLQREKDAARVLPVPEALEALMKFMAQRIDAALSRGGVSYDLARAVLGVEWRSPVEVVERGQFLQGLRDKAAAEFDRLVTAAERPARIARPAGLPADATVDPQAFEDPWESRLFAAAAEAAAAVEKALACEPPDYRSAVEALGKLSEPIDEFFSAVMVMVDDERLRTNRLALLGSIDRIFGRIADFLQVVRESS
jgi:glycyl-tRNA synthetase beta chain